LPGFSSPDVVKSQQVSLQAIILAESPLSQTVIAGVTVEERAVRCAQRVGAWHPIVIHDAADRQALLPHLRDATHVLVIRADQMMHPPLLQPLMEAMSATETSEHMIAVVPESAAAIDLAADSYAGAFVVAGESVRLVLDQLQQGQSDDVIAQQLRVQGAVMVPHGPIARHPVRNTAEIKAAHTLLYRILHKDQDNVITKYLYRPISFPLTVAFSKTSITPNQISLITAVLVGIGLWFIASVKTSSVIIGNGMILAASYVDCCDGEIARLKLLTSKMGAWLDTIIDEFSSVGSMLALGWHCHLYFGQHHWLAQPIGIIGGLDAWQWISLIGLVAYAAAIYCVYFNIIVVVGSANSQDYIGEFKVVPGSTPQRVRLAPVGSQAIATPKGPAWVQWLATYLPYMIRRDFICWAALGLAFLALNHVAFITMAVGGVVTIAVVGRDHVRLRLQLGKIADSGKILERGEA
jgi:hypothetical protein